MADKNLYAILEIPKDAAAKEIQKAVAKATVKYHPDNVTKKNPELSGAELEAKKTEAKAQLQAVDEAAKILKDEKLRQIYDAKGYDAVIRAMKPPSSSTPTAVKTGVKTYNEANQPPPAYSLDNMAKEYEDWNKSKTTTTNDKPKDPIVVDSSVDSARNARLARFGMGGNNPPSQTPPAQQPVTNVVQRKITPEPAVVPAKTPAPQNDGIGKKLEQSSEKVKETVTNAFNNSVAIPLDTLQSISENLQAVVDQINTEIRKAKGYKF